tara:strand:+ start:254 stop:502 length:249 start_codon:yes stop_codon:yes gene_type:complete
MNRLIVIGGASDRDTVDVPDGRDFIKINRPLPNNDWAGTPMEDRVIYEVYQRLNIEGVKVLALDSMTRSDVVHTLINHYLKQ